jgi:hypothetical protein
MSVSLPGLGDKLGESFRIADKPVRVDPRYKRR